MKIKVAICLDAELYREIERLRGMCKRSNYVQHLIELGIKAKKEAETNAIPISRKNQRS